MATSVINGFESNFAHRAAQGVSALSLMIALAAVPAYAQDVQPSEPAQAAAREDREDSAEIIVTAQSRKERLIDTPISIGVIDTARLEQGGSVGIIDALRSVGGVSAIQANPLAPTTIEVRGIVPGFGSSPVGYYVDDVPQTAAVRSGIADVGGFDVERIEVLRGPQGTLYGVNALSGVVRVLYTEPNLSDFETRARGGVSHTDGGGTNYNTDAVVNVPIMTDKLALRVGAGYTQVSGFIESLRDGKENIDGGSRNYVRAKLAARPTEDLSILLSYLTIGQDNIQSTATGAATGTTTIFSSNRAIKSRRHLLSGIVEYALPSMTLKSITGYFNSKNPGRAEINYGTATAPFIINFRNSVNVDAFSQELRLDSSNDGPLKWSAGAYYRDVTEREFQNASEALPTLPFDYIVEESSKSYAVFGSLSGELTDQLEVTGGLRYFHDDVQNVQLSDFFSPTNVVPTQRFKFEKVTWRAAIAYKPSRDLTFYGSVGTGYRSGTAQAAAVARGGFPPLNPDSLISYEVGAKGSLFDSAINFDTAVYYMDFKDLQQSLVTPSGFVLRFNAGRAKGFGIEGGITLRPVKNFSLRGAFGYSGLEFAENTFNGPALLFAKGDRINGSPEWTASIAGEYIVPDIAGDWDLQLRSDYNYRSQVSSRAYTQQGVNVSSSDSYAELGAAIGISKDALKFELFANNITNNLRLITPTSLTVGAEGVLQRPRTIGVQLSLQY